MIKGMRNCDKFAKFFRLGKCASAADRFAMHREVQVRLRMTEFKERPDWRLRCPEVRCGGHGGGILKYRRNLCRCPNF